MVVSNHPLESTQPQPLRLADSNKASEFQMTLAYAVTVTVLATLTLACAVTILAL